MASASPGTLLEVQILELQLRPTHPETRGWRLAVCVLTRSPGDSDTREGWDSSRICAGTPTAPLKSENPSVSVMIVTLSTSICYLQLAGGIPLRKRGNRSSPLTDEETEAQDLAQGRTGKTGRTRASHSKARALFWTPWLIRLLRPKELTPVQGPARKSPLAARSPNFQLQSPERASRKHKFCLVAE